MANNTFGLMSANAAMMAQNQNGTYEMANMLSNKLDDLQEAMYYVADNINPELVLNLDSRVLAKSTAKPMNKALGTIARRGGIT